MDIQKQQFSDLQSEFYKLVFLMENNKKNYNNYNKYILQLSDEIKNLELKIKELKHIIFSNKKSKEYKFNINELTDWEKDQHVLDTFKPFMLKYRMMIN